MCCSVSACQPDAGDGLNSDGFEQRESPQRTLRQAFQVAAFDVAVALPIGLAGPPVQCGGLVYPRSTEGDAGGTASGPMELALLGVSARAMLPPCRRRIEVRIGLRRRHGGGR